MTHMCEQIDGRPDGLPDNVATALGDLHEALGSIFSDRLDALYLYGSYARGTATGRSDVDVLVVLRSPFDAGREIARASQAVSDLSLEHDLLISLTPVPANWKQARWNAFLRQVHAEAIRL